jgi:hypothetical protein
MDSVLFATGLISFALGAAMILFAWGVVRQNRRREAARMELLTGLAFPDGLPNAPADVAPDAGRFSKGGDSGVESPRRTAGIFAIDEFRADEFPSEQSVPPETLFSEPEKSGAASRRTIALAAVAVVMTIGIGTYRWFAGTTASAAPAPAEAAAAATTVAVTPPEAPADPRVELLALNHSATPAAFLVTGRVRNPAGGAPLHDVVAVVHVLDRADRVLMTVRTPVKRGALNAGEWSDFSASASKATNVARYRVEFNARELQSIPQIDRRQTEPGSRSD